MIFGLIIEWFFDGLCSYDDSINVILFGCKEMY